MQGLDQFQQYTFNVVFRDDIGFKTTFSSAVGTPSYTLVAQLVTASTLELSVAVAVAVVLGLFITMVFYNSNVKKGYRLVE